MWQKYRLIKLSFKKHFVGFKQLNTRILIKTEKEKIAVNYNYMEILYFNLLYLLTK